MSNLAEVFAAEAEESCAVKLGVSTDIIISVRMKRLAVAIEPLLPSVVLGLHVDGERAPVVRLARDVIAALQHENSHSRRRQAMQQCSASRAAADDDHVVVVVVVHG